VDVRLRVGLTVSSLKIPLDIDRARSVPLTCWTAAIGLALIALAVAWKLAAGPAAIAYVALYALATLPGLPIGFALFGRRHAAGWVAGALTGYALSAFALWLPVQLHAASWPVFVLSWTMVTLLSFVTLRQVGPLVMLPVWSHRDTLALVLVLFAVPILLWKPFTNIGARDDAGSLRYRAYFTADFLWHVALTAELSRFQSPPRNPYLARRPLHYYWSYFVVPAVISKGHLLPSIQSHLAINALCAGIVFVASIFVFAWCAVPRAGPVAAATALALAGASAEGVHAIWDILKRGESLSDLRNLNIDAITSWFLRGLTVDGLPRSLWYTPQHAAACALSLVAVIVASAAPTHRPVAGILAGVALGLAVMMSPFLGGAFSLIYGLAALAAAVRLRPHVFGALSSTVPAAVPVGLALGWCVASGTFEGAGGAVVFGLSRAAAAAPFAVPALALGPLLLVALPALWIGWRFRIEPAIAALVVGWGLFYFVTLTAEPIWIGWRAGQILLVTLPALAGATIARLVDAGWQRLAIGLVATAFAIGVPTTMIDAYNAQDIRNSAVSPGGFRWTVVVPRDTQEALDWIRRSTPVDAVVQMSIEPRGRETWTLIPTFAERRMAAGQPISLLRMAEYEERSELADAMFATTDPAEAARLARALRADYVYLDRVERAEFGDAAIAKFEDSRYFTRAFQSGMAVVYAVR